MEAAVHEKQIKWITNKFLNIILKNYKYFWCFKYISYKYFVIERENKIKLQNKLKSNVNKKNLKKLQIKALHKY